MSERQQMESKLLARLSGKQARICPSGKLSTDKAELNCYPKLDQHYFESNFMFKYLHLDFLRCIIAQRLRVAQVNLTLLALLIKSINV